MTNTLPKAFIEDCSIVSIGSLGKQLLKKDSLGNFKQKVVKLENSDNKIGFKVYGERQPNLDITFLFGNKVKYQNVLLDLVPVNYNGERPYFLCGCGKRCSKLYLRDEYPVWACRRCLNLHYVLTSYNKQTRHGLVFYRFNRMNKSMRLRESISKIDYTNRLTHKALSFIHSLKTWAPERVPSFKI